MTILTVGSGQQFSTLAAAVAASKAGDTINVQAGTYYDDAAMITHALTIVGVGGYAHFVDTHALANDKANLVVDANLTIQNLEFSGATASGANGAGIRWETGNLTVLNSAFHDNQEGILAADNPTGVAVIKNSSFVHNGTGGDQAHGVYLGQVASLTADNDYFSNQYGGQDLKSRAAQNTITNSMFVDPTNGTTNYVIDLPNGGTDVVQNNYIQQSGTPGNSNIVHFGGEVANPTGSLVVSGNTIASYYGNAYAVLNQSSQTATITGNKFYNIAHVEAGGAASISANTTLSSQPSAPSWTGGYTSAGASPPPPPVAPPPPPAASPPPPPVASGPSGSPSGTLHGTGWVYGTTGNDSIVGDSGHDSLVGSGGNDTFSGGTYVQGFGGSDVINVASAGTFINEPNANNASVNSAVSFSLFDGTYQNVHKLTFTGSATVTGTGTWGNDTFVANAGNDSIVGNGGNDTFMVGTGNDTLVGAAGTDKAVFADSYASHHFSGSASNLTVTGAHTDLLLNIDTLQFSDVTVSTAQALAGAAGTSPPPPPPPVSPPPPPPPPAAGTIHGTGWVQGTSGNDSIVGDSGHDSLVGNGGNDSFSGGHYVQGFGGSDVITVNDGTTFIDEPNANSATVKSSVSFSLFDGSYNNVHNLTFTGNAAVTGTGTWGHDTLRANAGGDTLVGNGGGDTLVGGGGHDTFVFNSLSDKNSVVQGFVHGQDVLDVHAVLASVGSTGDALANHTLSLVQNGADTQVVVDDHGAKSTLVTLQGVAANTLNASDFHY